MPHFFIFKRNLFPICLLLFFFSFPSITLAQPVQTADEETNDQKIEINSSSFRSGVKALKNNLPDIAASHFQKTLESGPAKKQAWTSKQKTVIEQYLAESYARAGKSSEALELYSKLPMTPQNNYWTAIALIRQGSINKALHWLSQIPENDNFWSLYTLQAKAFIAEILNDSQLLAHSLDQLINSSDKQTSIVSRLWLINTCLKQDNVKKAIEIIEPLINEIATEEIPPQYKPYISLQQARILTSRQKWDEAKSLAENIAKDEKNPAKLKDLAQIILANIEIDRNKHNSAALPQKDKPNTENSQINNLNNGEEQLLAFISRRPDSSLLAKAFDILLKESTFLTNTHAMEQLVSWSNQSDQTRQPLASYVLSETLFLKNEFEQSIEVAQRSLKTSPSHPATRKLVLQAINYLIRNKKYEEASRLIHAYPHREAEIYFNSGIIAYEEKDYQKAQRNFELAINMANDSLIREAYLNANLNALELGDHIQLNKLIKDSFLMPDLQERLAYEQAHYAAGNYDPQAIEKLTTFIDYYPSSPLKKRAILDLAELSLKITPPKVDIAREQINTLKQLELTPEEEQRLDILQILIPESQLIWPEAIIACREALGKYENSEIADQLQLKLGELLFKNENFNDALVVLQSLPIKYPNSKLKKEAMFRAGMAAYQCDTEATLLKALEIFQTFINEKNTYSLLATIQIAEILQRKGQSFETIETLQDLLKQNPPRQIRLQALSIQAEAWATLNDDEDGTAMKKARDLCTEILETPNLRPSWRFSALSQRAQYSEKAGDTDSALEDYYSVLSYFSNTGNMSRSDWYWYYDTGFAALRILELKQEWEKAYALASEMGKTKGPKAREATRKAQKIKYEHFIWQDTEKDTIEELESNFFTPSPEADTISSPPQNQE